MSMLTPYTPQRAPHRGFSLVELIVAIGIFSIVMSIAVGSVLTIVDANRRAQNQQTVINNLNFALDSLARDVRVGTNYHCGSGSYASTADCSSDSTFAFEKYGGNPNDNNDQVVYRLYNNHIERSENSGASWIPVTADEIIIEGLTFAVEGSELGSIDQTQPKVTVLVWGYAQTGTAGKQKTTFNLQTSVSQRLLDLQ